MVHKAPSSNRAWAQRGFRSSFCSTRGRYCGELCRPEPRIGMVETALDGSRIDAVVRQFVAAAMPQHARVDLHVKARRAGRALLLCPTRLLH